jgi:GDP-L-fucose synthase
MEKSSKIYVAGHNGMVGSAIMRELRKQGYTNLITRSHSELDLCRQNEVEQFFEQSQPEYIFIAAAKVGGIKANSEFPVEFLFENLMIQNNLLLSAYKNKVKKLLFLGSSCIYPKECHQPMKEEYLLTGLLEPTNEPYAIAKIAGLRGCEYFNREYGTNYISVMPANSYGINDCFDPVNSHVIPALIRKYHEAKCTGQKDVILWGTGKPLREFLFVDDLADACIYLMNHYDSLEFINIGAPSEVSILELSQMIKDVVGYEGNIVCDLTKPDGMLRRKVNCEKLTDLGWTAKTDLRQGLEIMYQWFLENVPS